MRRSWIWAVVVVACVCIGVAALYLLVGQESFDLDGPDKLTVAEEYAVKGVLFQGLAEGTIYRDELGIPRRGVVVYGPILEMHERKRLPILRRLREAVRAGTPREANTATGTILALEGQAREAWLFVAHWPLEGMDEEDRSFGQSGKTRRERLLKWVDEVIAKAEANQNERGGRQ